MGGHQPLQLRDGLPFLAEQHPGADEVLPRGEPPLLQQRGGAPAAPPGAGVQERGAVPQREAGLQQVPGPRGVVGERRDRPRAEVQEAVPVHEVARDVQDVPVVGGPQRQRGDGRSAQSCSILLIRVACACSALRGLRRISPGHNSSVSSSWETVLFTSSARVASMVRTLPARSSVRFFRTTMETVPSRSMPTSSPGPHRPVGSASAPECQRSSASLTLRGERFSASASGVWPPFLNNFPNERPNNCSAASLTEPAPISPSTRWPFSSQRPPPGRDRTRPFVEPVRTPSQRDRRISSARSPAPAARRTARPSRRPSSRTP